MKTAASLKGWGLRPLCEEDLAKVAAIEARVHVAPWKEEHFQGELAKPYSSVWVITDDETDETIAAYIAFWLMNGECHILNVAVDIEFRGQGFAKLLVRKALSQAEHEGVSKGVLEVRKGNLAAISLYQGFGFEITQLRKRFYSNGEDAYIMCWPAAVMDEPGTGAAPNWETD